jgi:oxygen-independent coproporphyrinogen-3 oxidase
MQSANPNELRLLERIHTYEDVLDAVRWSRQAGFDNLNLDLIYGLPEQTLENWQRTVQLAVDLRPEHISAYALTIEPGTPFGRWAVQGKLPIPDPDLAADMYEWTLEFLAAQGYEQYEISNWARENAECRMMNDEFNSAFCIPYSAFQCRHNLQYWRNLDYLGLGAGAHGYAGGFRYSNALRIKTYIDRLKEPLSTFYFPLSPAVVHQHKNSPRDDMQETMITGLRLTREGVSAEVFQRRFGVQLTDVFGQEIDELLNLGLLEWHEARLRLTPRARLLSNQVFIRFVGD